MDGPASRWLRAALRACPCHRLISPDSSGAPPAAPPARPSVLPKKSRATIRALAAELRHAHLKLFAAAFAARLDQAGPGEYHLGAAGVLARLLTLVQELPG